MYDDLGDRMKAYESAETGRQLNSALPVYARIDGKTFSTFTRGMDRPWDRRMSDAMIETTKYLVEQTNAIIGYTQSDEISLVFAPCDGDSQLLFNAKVHKLTSVMAAMATAVFNKQIRGWEPYEDKLPVFDARVFGLPNHMEAVNALRWRYLDCKRNAISMAARARFSHNQLMNKNQSDMLNMLESVGVDFDRYPSRFRFGSFVTRELQKKTLSPSELQDIPIEHRPSEDTLYLRHQMMVWSTPSFMELKNPVDVIFYKEKAEM